VISRKVLLDQISVLTTFVLSGKYWDLEFYRFTHGFLPQILVTVLEAGTTLDPNVSCMQWRPEHWKPLEYI